MRAVLLFIAIALLVVNSGGTAKPSAAVAVVVETHPALNSSDTKPPRIDFDTQLKPIFQSKCMPCHFAGGKVYEQLPFDKAATIRKLGTRLFTRIKDKNETRLIEEFLSQSPQQ